MGLYSDSKYLIKEEIETVHKDHFLDFAVAGTWGNSEQRIAIASFAREVRYICWAIRGNTEHICSRKQF